MPQYILLPLISPQCMLYLLHLPSLPPLPSPFLPLISLLYLLHLPSLPLPPPPPPPPPLPLGHVDSHHNALDPLEEDDHFGQLVVTLPEAHTPAHLHLTPSTFHSHISKHSRTVVAFYVKCECCVVVINGLYTGTQICESTFFVL